MGPLPFGGSLDQIGNVPILGCCELLKHCLKEGQLVGGVVGVVFADLLCQPAEGEGSLCCLDDRAVVQGDAYLGGKGRFAVAVHPVIADPQGDGLAVGQLVAIKVPVDGVVTFQLQTEGEGLGISGRADLFRTENR